MKKVFCILLTLVLVIGICACGNNGKFTSEDGKVEVFQLAPESKSLMMSYVIKTPSNKIAIIDGGRDGEGLNAEPYILSAIRAILGIGEDDMLEIEAWFLTHQHRDHFYELAKCLERYDMNSKYKINNFYFDFPSNDEWKSTNNNDYNPTQYYTLRSGIAYYLKSNGATIPDDAVGPTGEPLTSTQRASYFFDSVNGAVVNEESVKNGLTITIDGVDFNILQTWSKNDAIINSNSMVIRMCYGEHSILFLGDSYVDNEKTLLKEYGADALKSEYVQMAHHGQSGCSEDFYKKIGTDKSKRLWPTPDWVWDVSSNNLRTGVTRTWLGLPENASDFKKSEHPDDYVAGLYDHYPEDPTKIESWNKAVLSEQRVAIW